MDDILSALDANVGAKIMKETILGVLKEKTVIMVTHALQYLKHSDYVYVMDEGHFFLQGEFSSIANSELYQKFTQLEEWSENQLQEQQEEQHLPVSPFRKASGLSENDVINHTFDENSLVAELNLPEDRQHGTMSLKIIYKFVKEFGGIYILVPVLLLNFLHNGIIMYANNYLQNWGYKFDPETKNSELVAIGSILFYGGSFEALSRIILAFVNYRTSIRVHNKMVFRVLHAKIEEFLNKIPSGRMMNRFSKDIDAIDKNVMSNLGYLIYLFSQLTVIFTTIGFALGWEMGGLLVVLTWSGFWYQKKYQTARREYKRLESISRSPMLNTSSDTIRGLPCVRNMKLETFMRKKFESGVNSNAKNILTSDCLKYWFNLRLGLCGVGLVHFPCYILMLFYFKELTVPKAGLFLVSILSLIQSFQNLINQIAEVEVAMISMERCIAFQNVDIENRYLDYEIEFKKIISAGAFPKKFIEKIETKRNQRKIIKEGKLEFRKVYARYSTSARPVLRNLSFVLRPGEKVGVVGRTGSGKSSLIKVIWRSLHISKGKILIDDQNISEIELKTLRSQMMVVTQEAALFQGSLLENLDPSAGQKCSKLKLIEILSELNFCHKDYNKKGLEMQIDANGSNLSEGEKQLVCFARCLVKPPKLIILDEATASIDVKTEELIQNCIEKHFGSSTMLVIAHRVQTVMECDRIIVLRDGEVEAIDTPQNLMKGDSFFKQIVEKMSSEFVEG